MEKRILLAFILSLSVLYAFRWLFPSGSSPATPAADSQVANSTSTPALPPVPAANTSNNKEPAPTVAEIADSPTSVHGEHPQDLVVNTALYTATVSNVGGVLKSFKLKQYSDASGKPIELINAMGAAKVGWPVAIVTADPKMNEQLSKAVYSGKSEGERLTLEYGEDGLYSRRILQFDRENYEFSLESTLTRNGMPVPYQVVWQGGFGDQSVPNAPATSNAVYQSDAATFKRLNVAGVKAPQEFTAQRAGLEDQYFLTMLMSPGTPRNVKVQKAEYPGADGKPVATGVVFMPASSDPVRFYVGPKMEKALKAADPELPAVIDYGWFGVIVRPLMFVLLWIHSYIGNFGWAIVLLTLLINFILFPIRLKQQVSMQKMQKVQPQMRTLQDKYKKLKANDPRRAQIQAEMMDVYKEHGVNPLSGCLPLLLQMPFLIAFYRMLSLSIELRQAPWMLWIHDLSQHDPYYVIPILMAVSMIVMQKMTPTTVDPAQAKMMLIMPVMLTFIFLRYASGLQLYWLTSNVVGVGQQVFINKYWAPQTEKKLRDRPGKKGSSS